MQVIRSLEVSTLGVIMLIGIVALTVELTEFEVIAKFLVVPSLVLLIVITDYSIYKISRK